MFPSQFQAHDGVHSIDGADWGRLKAQTGKLRWFPHCKHLRRNDNFPTWRADGVWDFSVLVGSGRISWVLDFLKYLLLYFFLLLELPGFWLLWVISCRKQRWWACDGWWLKIRPKCTSFTILLVIFFFPGAEKNGPWSHKFPALSPCVLIFFLKKQSEGKRLWDVQEEKPEQWWCGSTRSWNQDVLCQTRVLAGCTSPCPALSSQAASGRTRGNPRRV